MFKSKKLINKDFPNGKLIINLSMRELTDYAQKKHHTILAEVFTQYGSIVCTSANDIYEIIEQIDLPYFKAIYDIVPPLM